MKRRTRLLTVCLAALAVTPAAGDGLQVFGFFQNSFIRQSEYRVFDHVESARTSFSVQQHNLFFQKDLDARWRAFVDYEFLNSYNSARNWGSANLEEAWVRYRHDARFNVKVGLSIPVFNNLNEIKNRTPILPYIVRPLVYETSFGEFIAVEEYLPSRAFLQVYGFVPAADTKLDYALFLGNGPNLNDHPETGQTGVDTTAAYLMGGRVGVRRGELKVGLSMTRDRVNARDRLTYGEGLVLAFEQVPRRRLGADLSYLWRDLSFEAEAIRVDYDEDEPEAAFDKEFYYATLGYRIDERWFVYASYYRTEEEFVEPQPDVPDAPGLLVGAQRVHVPTVGVSCQARDSIVFKAQYAPVELDGSGHDIDDATVRTSYDARFNHLSASVSVVF